MVELTCLGPPQLRVDGAEAPPELVWRKHLALLVYLARSPRGRTRDHLMGLLWSDKDQAKARHSLNEALRVLRRSLGDHLLTDGDVVRVTPGAVVTDLEPLDAARIGGEFLEGFAVPDAPEFEDWLARERTQLRAASLDLLVQAAERALDEGRTREARDTAARALGLDPHHEPAALVLMRAHVLEGARALALEVYQRLADALQRDLGAEPSPAARELADRARTGVVVRGTPPPATPPAEERVPLVGVGRRLLVALCDAWREAAAGSARLVLLRGDPGTGKTRLADELAARARLDGAAVAYARALDGDSVADLVGAWVRGGLAVPELAGAPPAALAGLAAADPDLLVRFPGARSAAPQSIGEALTACAFAVAETRPLLLVLDDAHQAAAEVLAAIGRLAQRGRPARLGVLLTVATQPAADTDAVSERIGRDLPGKELATGPLADADVGELVAWALPRYRRDEAERLVRRVMADTAGNPFLAVELVLAVRAGLTLSAGRDDRAWPERRRTLDDTLPSELPPSVAAALRSRYRALAIPAQRALAALAVLGGRAPLDAVARGADVSRAELEQALDELEWQRWLVGDAHGYAFVTRLAREVILADMVTAGERRRIRERAGVPER